MAVSSLPCVEYTWVPVGHRGLRLHKDKQVSNHDYSGLRRAHNLFDRLLEPHRESRRSVHSASDSDDCRF